MKVLTIIVLLFVAIVGICMAASQYKQGEKRRSRDPGEFEMEEEAESTEDEEEEETKGGAEDHAAKKNGRRRLLEKAKEEEEENNPFLSEEGEIDEELDPRQGNARYHGEPEQEEPEAKPVRRSPHKKMPVAGKNVTLKPKESAGAEKAGPRPASQTKTTHKDSAAAGTQAKNGTASPQQQKTNASPPQKASIPQQSDNNAAATHAKTAPEAKAPVAAENKVPVIDSKVSEQLKQIEESLRDKARKVAESHPQTKNVTAGDVKHETPVAEKKKEALGVEKHDQIGNATPTQKKPEETGKEETKVQPPTPAQKKVAEEAPKAKVEEKKVEVPAPSIPTTPSESTSVQPEKRPPHTEPAHTLPKEKPEAVSEPKQEPTKPRPAAEKSTTSEEAPTKPVTPAIQKPQDATVPEEKKAEVKVHVEEPNVSQKSEESREEPRHAGSLKRNFAKVAFPVMRFAEASANIVSNVLQHSGEAVGQRYGLRYPYNVAMVVAVPLLMIMIASCMLPGSRSSVVSALRSLTIR